MDSFFITQFDFIPIRIAAFSVVVVVVVIVAVAVVATNRPSKIFKKMNFKKQKLSHKIFFQ